MNVSSFLLLDLNAFNLSQPTDTNMCSQGGGERPFPQYHPYESFHCRRAAQDGKISVIYMTRKIPVKFLPPNGVFRKRSPVCDGKLWFVIVEFLAGKKSADAHWKEKEK